MHPERDHLGADHRCDRSDVTPANGSAATQRCNARKCHSRGPPERPHVGFTSPWRTFRSLSVASPDTAVQVHVSWRGLERGARGETLGSTTFALCTPAGDSRQEPAPNCPELLLPACSPLRHNCMREPGHLRLVPQVGLMHPHHLNALPSHDAPRRESWRETRMACAARTVRPVHLPGANVVGPGRASLGDLTDGPGLSLGGPRQTGP